MGYILIDCKDERIDLYRVSSKNFLGRHYEARTFLKSYYSPPVITLFVETLADVSAEAEYYSKTFGDDIAWSDNWHREISQYGKNWYV